MDLITPVESVAFKRSYKIRLLNINIPNQGPLQQRKIVCQVYAFEVIDGVIDDNRSEPLGEWFITLMDVAMRRFTRAGQFDAASVSPLELASDLETILTELWLEEQDVRIASGALDAKYRTA